MKIPAKIVVGPLTFRVVRDINAINAAQVEARSGLYGETDLKSLRINLHPHNAPGRQRVTLLHEVLHAVWYCAGLDRVGISEDQAETVVNGLSEVLLDTLRRNPVFVRFLLDKEE